jgi:hypothetical protein
VCGKKRYGVKEDPSRENVERVASRKGVPGAENMVPRGGRHLLPFSTVTPTFRMPSPQRLHEQATLAEIYDALSAARCSAQLAGLETRDFVIRELLLTVIERIDRAAAGLRRLG